MSLAISSIKQAHPLAPYAILDTLPEPDYDDITALAVQICDTPIALITFAYEDRLWFKSVLGWDVPEIGLNESFCVHVLHQSSGVLYIPDTMIDVRFCDKSLVKDEAQIRFYAGAPIMTPAGDAIGTICVMDYTARELSERQRAALQTLARQVTAQLELRRTIMQLGKTELEVEDYQHQLELALVQLDRENGLDALTGVHNRRFFDTRLAEEVERAIRYQEPLSLLLLDVDHFKSYNDTFGHPAGDDLLRRLGRQLRGTLRACDVLARYGGEEFAVILPNTSSEQAFPVADRLRQAVEAMPDIHRRVTVSMGVASVDAVSQDGAALVSAADQGLYLAKQQGRNRVAAAIQPVKLGRVVALFPALNVDVAALTA